MASSSGDLTNGGGATASAPTTTTTTTKPLTMFYNGGVAVFHLPQDKAEVVMNMAAGEDGRDDDGGRHRRPNHGEELLAKLRQGCMGLDHQRLMVVGNTHDEDEEGPTLFRYHST
ncbi:uncharacterized protein [Miscanthus floridulus]|uniref:uncharacterized protein isoform X2 n=1 Tax=Miscanthus floridulus TaxID=154761 RepID=UPI00345861A8